MPRRQPVYRSRPGSSLHDLWTPAAASRLGAAGSLRRLPKQLPAKAHLFSTTQN